MITIVFETPFEHEINGVFISEYFVRVTADGTPDEWVISGIDLIGSTVGGGHQYISFPVDEPFYALLYDLILADLNSEKSQNMIAERFDAEWDGERETAADQYGVFQSQFI